MPCHDYVRLCVCVCGLATGQSNEEKLSIFVRVRICYTFLVMMPIDPALYRYSTTTNDERHEYTCNLLICLIYGPYDSLSLTWLSIDCYYRVGNGYAWYGACLLNVTVWCHNLFDDFDTDCYDENWSPMCLPHSTAAAVAWMPKLNRTRPRWNRKM